MVSCNHFCVSLIVVLIVFFLCFKLSVNQLKGSVYDFYFSDENEEGISADDENDERIEKSRSKIKVIVGK